MHLQWIDWLIVLIPLVVVAVVAGTTQRHVKSVADFMVASRVAGRYLLCNARGEAAFGAISAIALFEMFYNSGLSITWWQTVNTPAQLFLAMTGFVICRYRDTRAMTLAQFFEMRYSRRFRVFAGVLGFVSGALNYGIFPAVGARFFVNFCGFPQQLALGPLHVPTFVLLMALFLSYGLTLTLLGGQLTIIVTTCLEGLWSSLVYLLIAGALLVVTKWSQVVHALSAQPQEHSLINPFDSGQVKDFNIWYVIIGVITMFYTTMSWQGGHAFNSSAANPHETKMANVLGIWKNFARTVMITLLGICAYTYLHDAGFASGARAVQASLSKIADPRVQEQMRVPVALAYLLPVGVKGAFCSIMLFAMLANDGSYLHSWGSILVQDVILPLRSEPLTPQQHLRLLRWAIAGVAVFAFFFSWFFRQTEYIYMFFLITGAIYLGGAGAVIIGGLYWKKGTTAAAWCSMIAGSTVALAGIGIKQLYPNLPLNGQQVCFIAMIIAAASYAVVSILTCREDFDMERLLHRGKWAVAQDAVRVRGTPKLVARWTAVLGFDKYFTRGDRIISGGLAVWSLAWFAVFLVGTMWNLVAPWSIHVWSQYWLISTIVLPGIIGVVTTVWFTIGGVIDLKKLFVALRVLRRDAEDDGTVPEQEELPEQNQTACEREALADPAVVIAE